MFLADEAQSEVEAMMWVAGLDPAAREAKASDRGHGASHLTLPLPVAATGDYLPTPRPAPHLRAGGRAARAAPAAVQPKPAGPRDGGGVGGGGARRD